MEQNGWSREQVAPEYDSEEAGQWHGNACQYLAKQAISLNTTIGGIDDASLREQPQPDEVEFEPSQDEDNIQRSPTIEIGRTDMLLDKDYILPVVRMPKPLTKSAEQILDEPQLLNPRKIRWINQIAHDTDEDETDVVESLQLRTNDVPAIVAAVMEMVKMSKPARNEMKTEVYEEFLLHWLIDMSYKEIVNAVYEDREEIVDEGNLPSKAFFIRTRVNRYDFRDERHPEGRKGLLGDCVEAFRSGEMTVDWFTRSLPEKTQKSKSTKSLATPSATTMTQTSASESKTIGIEWLSEMNPFSRDARLTRESLDIEKVDPLRTAYYWKPEMQADMLFANRFDNIVTAIIERAEKETDLTLEQGNLIRSRLQLPANDRTAKDDGKAGDYLRQIAKTRPGMLKRENLLRYPRLLVARDTFNIFIATMTTDAVYEKYRNHQADARLLLKGAVAEILRESIRKKRNT